MSAGSYAPALYGGVYNPPTDVDGVVLVSDSSSSAYNPRYVAQVNDGRGGNQTSLQLVVGPVSGSTSYAGLYSYLPGGRAILFNTAPITGTTVSSQVSLALVSHLPAALGGPYSDASVTPAAGTCTASGLGAVLSVSSCLITLSAAQTTGGTAAIAFTSQGLSAQQPVVVLAPLGRLSVTLGSTLLQRLISTSNPLYQSGCTSPQYQNTSAAVLVSFGGTGLAPLGPVDVTSLIAGLTSNASAVATVSGSSVSGVAAGYAGIGVSLAAAASPALLPAAPAPLQVSDTLICVSSLDVVAVTSATLTSSSTASPAALAPFNVSVSADQALNTEGATAALRAYLVTADGSVSDVTAWAPLQSANTSLVNVSYSGPAGSPELRVSGLIGTAQTCGLFIWGEYSICGVPVGTGQAPIKLALPLPVK